MARLARSWPALEAAGSTDDVATPLVVASIGTRLAGDQAIASAEPEPSSVDVETLGRPQSPALLSAPGVDVVLAA